MTDTVRLTPLPCVMFAGSMLLNACIFSDDSSHSAAHSATADPAGADAGFDVCSMLDAPRDRTSQGCPGTAFGSAVHDAAVPAPFVRELASLMTQSVRWASADVSVTGAGLERGQAENVGAPTDTSFLFSGGSLDPAAVYVKLDLKLENKGADELDYTERATWDLVLRNGTRLSSIDALGVRVLPGDSAATSLHYVASENTDLTGAALELNCEDRTACEPEHVPLDARYVQEFPRRIESLVGQMVDYWDGSLGLGPLHVDEAVYDLNYARKTRAKRDMRAVWLSVAMTAPGTSSSTQLFDTGALRISVNGRASAPSSHEIIVADRNTTHVLSVEFEIPKTATAFEIMIPDGTPNGQRFPVDVADTRLALDIP